MGGSLATIPLMGQRAPAPVELQDPNQQLMQMVQLASLLQNQRQQQAMAPYQMEAAEAASEAQKMQLEELRRQQREQQSLADALGDVKGDMFSPDFAKSAAKRGVSATTLMSLQKQLDESIASHSKRQLEEINLEKAKNAEIADILGTVKDPASMMAAVDRLVKSGYLEPDEGAEIVKGGYDPDTVTRYANLHRGANAVLDRAIKEQQLATARTAVAASAATTEKTKVETGKMQAELDAIKNAKPEDYEALVDQIVPPGIKENAALNARTKAQIRFALKQPDGIKQAQEILKAAASEVRQLEVATDPRVQANKIVLATELQKARTTAGNLIPQQEEPGKTYTVEDVPASIRPQVENALKYQSALPPQSRLNPAAQAIRWWTMKLDPNYSEELFPVRKAAVMSMNVGKDHQKLNAMNTVLGHVGRLEEAVDALQNNDVRVLNQIANELGVQTGTVAPVVFRTIVHRVGPELTQAYVGSGGEAAERKEAGGDFDVNGAPAQIKGAARITAKLLASKMGSLLFDFKRAARFTPEDPRGKDLVRQFFTPEATSVMDRMFPGWEAGVEPGGAGGGGGGARQYVQYGRSGNKVVGFTADGRLWDVNSGKELDPKTGKEK